MSPTTGRRVSVRALLIPADLTRPCQVLDLTLTAAAFSDAIGGGLLDEPLTDTSTPPDPGTPTGSTGGYTLYADADRTTKQLPDNPRATLLAARLGWAHLADHLALRGDLLLTGTDPAGNDTDLPHHVLDAAHRTGLLPCTCQH